MHERTLRKELWQSSGSHYNLPDHSINDMHIEVIYILHKKKMRELTKNGKTLNLNG